MVEIAKIEVSSVYARVTRKTPIPKGIIGAQVRITYTDPLWDNLRKTVVFNGSGATIDVLDAGELIQLPAEVMVKVGASIKVGVYGTDADENIAIPTLWADIGKVHPAADPSGDESTDPSLPVWAQLDGRVTKLEEGGTGGGASATVEGETLVFSDSSAVTIDGETLIM